MASKWEDWTNGFRINVKDFLSIIFTATSAMSDQQTVGFTYNYATLKWLIWCVMNQG